MAERLGVDDACGTQVEVRRGVLTGDVIEPMIGPAKADRLAALCREQGIARADSIAYGDHVSDLPMLCAAGHAVVVGDDQEMAREASGRGWARLPGCALPNAA